MSYRLGKTLLSRLIQLLFVVWATGTLTFIMMRSIGGDMAYRIAASRYGYDATNQAAAELVKAELGLDLPWYQSYFHWLFDLAQLNLGKSLVTGQSVWKELSHQFGHTLTLAVVALCLSLLISLPIGIWAGLRAGGTLDRLTIVLSTAIRSIPAFMMGILLIIVFAINLKWLPVAGYGTPWHYILPALTLAVGLAGLSIRITRHTVASVVASEYYEFSRLKGLSNYQTFIRHGIRNIAIPIIAFHTAQLVYFVEGVVIVESVFAWPGSGHALVHAIFARDIPMIQGTALLIGALFVVLNAVVDVINGHLDPRIQTHKRQKPKAHALI